jgi:hypothetical protein
MQSCSLTILFLALFSAGLSDAQEVYRATRSLEEQQSVSHIGQAEYYMRMALRSLEASAKIGRAPYFNYQNAREDLEKVLAEFKTYLKGDESTDLPPAVPLIVDGRYFAESIRDFLATQKVEERQAGSNLPAKGNDTHLAASNSPSKSSEPNRKKTVPETESKILQRNSAPMLPPPALPPQNDKTRRDKIEEILKKGL